MGEVQYARELAYLLSKPLLHAFVQLYDHTRERNKTPRLILREFQGTLREACKSPLAVLQRTPGIDELDHVMTRMRIGIPNNVVLETCFVEAARDLWKRPYLLFHKVSKLERRQHMAELEGGLRRCVKSAVCSLLLQFPTHTPTPPPTLSADSSAEHVDDTASETTTSIEEDPCQDTNEQNGKSSITSLQADPEDSCSEDLQEEKTTVGEASQEKQPPACKEAQEEDTFSEEPQEEYIAFVKPEEEETTISEEPEEEDIAFVEPEEEETTISVETQEEDIAFVEPEEEHTFSVEPQEEDIAFDEPEEEETGSEEPEEEETIISVEPQEEQTTISKESQEEETGSVDPQEEESVDVESQEEQTTINKSSDRKSVV